MPQDGAGNYYYPPGTPGIPDQTIESEKYNAFLDDLVVNDLNIPRPVHRGGTGANNAAEARDNLSAEACDQLVTNYDTHLFYPGSFRSAAGATGAPNGHAFAGICYLNEALAYPLANLNFVLEARDEGSTDIPGFLYVRERKAGVWAGPWAISDSNLIEGDVAVNNGDVDVNDGDVNVNGGDINIIDGNLNLVSPVGSSNEIHGQHTTGAPPTAKDRWVLVLGDGTPEDGVPPNDGSNYLLKRYDDAGVLIDTVMSFNRATGEGSFTKTPTAPTMVVPTNDLHIATTQFVWDAVPVIARRRLDANKTYYVNAGAAIPGNVPPIAVGSDAFDGSPAGPWKTLQKAVDTICTTIDLGAYNVDVKCFGNFTAGMVLGHLTRGNGTVHFIGDIAGSMTVLPTVSISVSSGLCILGVSCGGGWMFSGFKLTGSLGLVLSQGQTNIKLGNKMAYDLAQTHIGAADGGSIEMANANYIINNAASYAHMNAGRSGIIAAQNTVVNIIIAPPTMTAFAIAEMCGVIITPGMTYTGQITGPKYICATAGGVNAGGSGNFHMPGSLAGSLTAPGWYAP